MFELWCNIIWKKKCLFYKLKIIMKSISLKTVVLKMGSSKNFIKRLLLNWPKLQKLLIYWKTAQTNIFIDQLKNGTNKYIYWSTEKMTFNQLKFDLTKFSPQRNNIVPVKWKKINITWEIKLKQIIVKQLDAVNLKYLIMVQFFLSYKSEPKIIIKKFI